MSNLLLIGFLIGMRHALEADHLAAMATIATRTSTLRSAARHGLAWGLGHTLTLFAVGTAVIAVDAAVPDRVAAVAEAVVGVMLVILGLDVVRRVVRDRVHFHVHAHADDTRHFHAHAHAGQRSHDPERHQHPHPEGFPLRALAVGLVHGLAGSAALIVLALGTAESVPVALAYMLTFGVGSMAGMACLSAVIAVPMRFRPKGLTWLYNGLHAFVGIFSIGLGIAVVARQFG